MSDRNIKANKGKHRVLFEIPDFNNFGELLHDRLHAIFYHIEEWESKFMLLTNLYDRDPIRIQAKRDASFEDLESLVYCGTDRSRAILEKDLPLNYINELKAKGQKFNEEEWKRDRNKNWQFLRNREMDRNYPGLRTFPYFDDFRNDNLLFSAVKVEPLSDYFKEFVNNSKFTNDIQKNEHPIFSDYFDIKKDKYIGIPLLGMGVFQGIVWILFQEEESEKLDDPKNIRRIIKLFQIEYDNLTFDWDVANTNIKQKSLMKSVIDEVNPTNDIQEVVKLKKYYEISEHYHTNRIDQSDKVVNELKNQFFKTAIITILLDSYAHNISAHSLTTLSWWFREKAEFLSESDDIGKARIHKKHLEKLGRSNNPLIKHYESSEQDSLAKELAPLFKFLLEKGAFWSGITRQTNFTGKTSSLFNILWFDFINNPLYLGTIANTEQVRKLHINITCYESEESTGKSGFQNSKVIKKSKDGLLLDGRFASIDLAKFTQQGNSLFVKEDEHFFEALAETLKDIKVFFPGGVVGKHAFFTLLENEIRNVKHYDGEILKDIQENGLTLNISIHKRPVDSTKKTTTTELLKVGVWLKHKVDLEPDLLLDRIKGLDADIITDDTFQPRLGGSFQDKICASMLLNNTFEKVQDTDTELGLIYYPWIKTASALILQDKKSSTQEFEVSHRRLKTLNKEELISIFTSVRGVGYLKKYFHLWLGAEIMDADKTKTPENNSLENYARFRFLYLPLKAQQYLEDYKKLGVIRILKDSNKPTDLASAYQQWLPNWLRPNNDSHDFAIDLVQGTTSILRISYVNRLAQFESINQIRESVINKQKRKAHAAIKHKKRIVFAHGSSLSAEEDKFNYRSHGELVQRFGKGLHPKKIKEMSEDLVYELIETMMTRICIFDRRIYNRMVNLDSKESDLQIKRLQLYKHQLQLDIKNEKLAQWKNVRSGGFLEQNFLVLHLSFIEHLKDSEGRPYSEQRIIDFIDEQVLEGQNPEEVGQNFILIITTGRGRMAWWDKIKEHPEYARFTTFRPIESILGAVEDALEMPDDFNLKYNLTKLLFGS